jgi:hypothetical protein
VIATSIADWASDKRQSKEYRSNSYFAETSTGEKYSEYRSEKCFRCSRLHLKRQCDLVYGLTLHISVHCFAKTKKGSAKYAPTVLYQETLHYCTTALCTTAQLHSVAVPP